MVSPSGPSLLVLAFSLFISLFLIQPARDSLHAIGFAQYHSSEMSERFRTGRILLLTAHPDDECMFFAPTVQSLTAYAAGLDGTSPEIFSLCLSTGNADGLGAVRRSELERSLEVLGIKDGHRWVENRPELQDNITVYWDSEVIADVVKPYVLKHRIDTILTFDHVGISSHPNHASLPAGALRLIAASRSSTASARGDRALKLYTLVSVPLLQKYTGPLSQLHKQAQLVFSEIIRSFSLKRPLDPAGGAPPNRSYNGHVESKEGRSRSSTAVVIFSWEGYRTALRAMLQHRSQLVWFRWLYVAFSQYMWVNDWVEVDVS